MVDRLVQEADQLIGQVTDAVLPARPTDTSSTEGAVQEWEEYPRLQQKKWCAPLIWSTPIFDHPR